MTRFYGAIGFAETIETAPGVWQDRIIEKMYKGIVSRYQTRYNQGSEMNDELRIDNELSIVSDPFLDNHVASIRYVVWMGSKWKVTSISVKEPRLVLQIGGLYNEH